MKILHWKDSEGHTGHGEPMEDEICDINVEFMRSNTRSIIQILPYGKRELVQPDPTIKYWAEPVDDSKGKQNSSHR